MWAPLWKWHALKHFCFTKRAPEINFWTPAVRQGSICKRSDASTWNKWARENNVLLFLHLTPWLCALSSSSHLPGSAQEDKLNLFRSSPDENSLRFLSFAAICDDVGSFEGCPFFQGLPLGPSLRRRERGANESARVPKVASLCVVAWGHCPNLFTRLRRAVSAAL